MADDDNIAVAAAVWCLCETKNEETERGRRPYKGRHERMHIQLQVHGDERWSNVLTIGLTWLTSTLMKQTNRAAPAIML